MKITVPISKTGYTSITKLDDLDWEHPSNPKMNFGILKLDAQKVFLSAETLERAFLILQGNVHINWNIPDSPLQHQQVARASIWDQSPWCLHVPAGISVQLIAESADVEVCIIATKNDVSFPVKLYTPEECRSEHRGAGTMRETSTRIVRTIFDYSNCPQAKLVLGEVITFPGKWSSYPPHHHPQPEIYHYRFLPNQGFGFGMLGDNVVKVHNNDTVLILNDVSHPQVAAPGYAMYYIWAIYHLDNQPYKTPIFEPEHTWVIDPKKQNKIWPYNN